MTEVVPLRASSPLPLLLALCACAGGARAPAPGRAPSPSGPSGGEERALVVRGADPVFVKRPGERAATPLAYYGKEARLPAGSWVLVGPGGRAEVAFPDGSAAAASGEAALEILEPSASEGTLLRAASLRRLEVEIHGGARFELPGGAVARGDGGRFLARLVDPGLLRVESRGSSPVRIRLAGEEVELSGARYADYPARGVAGAAR